MPELSELGYSVAGGGISIGPPAVTGIGNNGADLYLNAGEAEAGGRGGNLNLNGGYIGEGNGGAVNIIGGNSDDGPGGDLLLSGGAGDTTGNIILDNLPTADPTIPGALWVDAGVLKISAG